MEKLVGTSDASPTLPTEGGSRASPRSFSQEEVLENLQLVIQNLGNVELCQVLDYLEDPVDSRQLSSLSTSQWTYLMMNSGLVFCPYHLWLRAVSKPEVMYGVVSSLLDMVKAWEKKRSAFQMQF